MLTFLPSPDFDICARVLHSDHLKRCIQEAWWIYLYFSNRENTSITASKRWKPVYSLWIDRHGTPQIQALKAYQQALNREWFNATGFCHCGAGVIPGPAEANLLWTPEVHASHRGRLLNHPTLSAFYSLSFDLYGVPKGDANTGLIYTRPWRKRDDS